MKLQIVIEIDAGKREHNGASDDDETR